MAWPGQRRSWYPLTKADFRGLCDLLSVALVVSFGMGVSYTLGLQRERIPVRHWKAIVYLHAAVGRSDLQKGPKISLFALRVAHHVAELLHLREVGVHQFLGQTHMIARFAHFDKTLMALLPMFFVSFDAIFLGPWPICGAIMTSKVEMIAGVVPDSFGVGLGVTARSAVPRPSLSGHAGDMML